MQQSSTNAAYHAPVDDILRSGEREREGSITRSDESIALRVKAKLQTILIPFSFTRIEKF